MRVLLVNSVASEGSTGKIVSDLYRAYLREGFECMVAYGRGKGNDEIQTYKIGNRLDFYVHAIGTRILDDHGLMSKRATNKFIKFIENYSPDIIHLHNIHGYYLNINILFKYLKRANKKIIWTMHDCWAFSPGAAYIDYLDDGRLPNEKRYTDDKKQYPKTSFFRRPQRNYLLKKSLFSGLEGIEIITPSLWLASLMSDSFFCQYEIETIYNGIQLEKFIGGSRTLTNDRKKVILGVANVWDERKGLPYFNQIAEHFPSHQVIIVGGISNGKLHSKILHIERTSNIEELSLLYRQADVFVNPTLADNFPTTNLESLAAGTPIVAFDTGGNAEVVDDSVGKLVEVNTEALIAGIETVLENTQNNYEKNCKMRSLNFSREKMCENYVRMIKENY